MDGFRIAVSQSTQRAAAPTAHKGGMMVGRRRFASQLTRREVQPLDAFCVHCDHKIVLGTGFGEGYRVTCPACRAYLEVINLSPVELDWAYDEPYPVDQEPGVWGDRRDTGSEMPQQQ
jgi:hypothetical protein